MECARVESCTKQNRNEAAEKMLATMSANTLKRDKENPKQRAANIGPNIHAV
jgi:hypothetical protein